MNTNPDSFFALGGCWMGGGGTSYGVLVDIVGILMLVTALILNLKGRVPRLELDPRMRPGHPDRGRLLRIRRRYNLIASTISWAAVIAGLIYLLLRHRHIF